MKILVSYAPLATSLEAVTFHTNSVECRAIVESLVELGNEVDFIDCRNDLTDEAVLNYDLVFGEGSALLRSINFKNKKRLTIFYATTQSPLVVYEKEFKSHINQNANAPHGVYRGLEIIKNLPLLESDVIISLGNSNTRNTYSSCPQPLYSIYPTGFDSKFEKNPIENKSKKNILFFSGGGAALKGLYHAVEFIRSHADFRLIICGPLCKEVREIADYSTFMQRVTLHEHIFVPSPEWHSIVSSCFFSIFPSYSEGASTSLITCMRAGLIPIASSEVGVDISNLGFEIRDLSTAGLERVIERAMLYSDEQLGELSNLVYQKANEMFNIFEYKKNMKFIFNRILSEFKTSQGIDI